MTLLTSFVASGLAAVTPSDTAFVDFVGLLVGGAGAVSVVDSLGATTTVTAVAGQTINARIVQVRATGTTATGLVGLKP
jgi:hypothetical protein